MKTAIILRGQPRTWNFVKSNIFRIFNYLYDPDWYVVMTTSGTVTYESIAEDFKGSKLVSVQLLDESQYPFHANLNPTFVSKWKYRSGTHWKQAWFDYIGNLAKRKHELENKFRYDNVLGMRPDCYYFANFENQNFITDTRIKLDKMKISDISLGGQLSVNDWITPDFTWRAGPMAADLFCTRYIDSYFTDGIDNQALHYSEFTLPVYFISRNYIDGTRNIGTIPLQMVRPNDVGDWPWNEEILRTRPHTWHLLSKDEKLSWCEKTKISPKDYQL